MANPKNGTTGTGNTGACPYGSRDEMLRNVTADYLAQIGPNIPDPEKIQKDILTATAIQCAAHNAACSGKNAGPDPKWKVPDRLAPAQIADILMFLYPIRNIAYGGLSAEPEYDILSIYMDSGPDMGIYVPDDRILYSLVHKYAYTMSDRETKDTIALMEAAAPRTERCSERNLIAVNNGIFDYDTKTLMPFTPDLVFISKSRVNYNPSAQNPVIHDDSDDTDWDIESWMLDLFDNDKDMTELAWQIIGAIIRPNVPWNKSAWFYSTTGNNGKGTLCELMRQIAGNRTYASIPIADFSKDFMLEPLLRASCIITDENDVGAYIDKAANLKAITTNDTIQMNRKFKTPIAFQFRGFMVQCLNEMPKIRDRSESFYRRQLFIPFDKCFTGNEKKYIKHDWLHRKDVLEYALRRVLEMDYYSLSEPARCREALEEYKEFNDPIRQFCGEVITECVWDFIPYTFLYDLYKAWFKSVNPTGTSQGRNTFISDIRKMLAGSPEWECPDATVRPGKMMDAPEPLILRYGLKEWTNPAYRGTDPDQICRPALKARYKGIIRRSAIPAAADPDEVTLITN